MAKFIFQAGVFFGSPLFPGDTSTQITVYDAETDLPVETLWEDEDGTVELSNPFNIAEEGHFFFYADAGKYNILATMGVLSRPWNDVILGGSGGGGGALPPGGSAGQVLAKASNANYDTEWVAAGGGSDRRTVTAVTSSAGIVTIDYALGDYFTLELSENVIGWSILNPPAAGVGGTIAIRITQDHVSRTVVWDPNYHQFTASSPLDKVRSDPGSDTLLIMTTFGDGIWMATMDTHA